ncbi:hypothetical protein K1719_016083 [Acacia pycnantha]|nr:hypothetical protein K1719_016083 [Acacia pycnantha]
MTSSVKTVTLISDDDDVFEISVNAAAQSNLIKNLLEDVGVSGNVPINNVNSATLAKVTEYCTKHADREATVEDGGAEEELRKWDAEFLKVDSDMLLRIASAAHYLDIKSLYDLSCQAVADRIKGKTTEQIRQTFDLQNDFTPEEEEEIRKENEWAFED